MFITPNASPMKVAAAVVVTPAGAAAATYASNTIIPSTDDTDGYLFTLKCTEILALNIGDIIVVELYYSGAPTSLQSYGPIIWLNSTGTLKLVLISS